MYLLLANQLLIFKNNFPSRRIIIPKQSPFDEAAAEAELDVGWLISSSNLFLLGFASPYQLILEWKNK